MNRDFKGIWIPREIWFHPKLTVTDKMLFGLLNTLGESSKKNLIFESKKQLDIGKNRTTTSYQNLEKENLIEIIRIGLGKEIFLKVRIFNES